MTISWLVVSLRQQHKSAPYVCIRATTHDATWMINLGRERPIVTKCPSGLGYHWRNQAGAKTVWTTCVEVEYIKNILLRMSSYCL